MAEKPSPATGNSGGKTENLKPWRKGQSGNPSGRPKKALELQARCIKAVDEHVVGKWISEVESRGEDWVECSKLLAAYGYGKPSQRLEVSGSEGGPLEIVIRKESACE